MITNQNKLHFPGLKPEVIHHIKKQEAKQEEFKF